MFLITSYSPSSFKIFKKILEKYKGIDGAKIVYESPFRVEKLVEQIKEVYGDEIQIKIVREMTKKFEEVVTDTPKNLKGEFVVIFG